MWKREGGIDLGVRQKIGGIWEKALILLLNITKFQDQRNKQEIGYGEGWIQIQVLGQIITSSSPKLVMLGFA